MRAQRIKTGFHRIGLVGAALLLAPAAAMFLYGAWQAFSNKGLPNAKEVIAVALLTVAGFAFYAAARAVGWIFAGFAGDDT